MWEWKCENLGLSEEENRTKQWGFYLLLPHLEPIIILLRSLEKICTFLVIDQILLCTFLLFKILVISAETSMHLVVLAPNSSFTKNKKYPVGRDFNRGSRNHIYISSMPAYDFWVLYTILCCSCFYLAGNCLSLEVNYLDVVSWKIVCMFEVSSR